MKKFTQRELAEKYGIPSKTLSNWLKIGKFVPVEYNGARKPCFYHEDQLPKLEELIKTDYFPMRKKETPAVITVEPAPVIDTEKLIAEPLEQKSLEELAEEANFYTTRGDDCFKQGLTFYFAAGRRLNEAKGRLEHGQWQPWLAENFSGSADTASNYMNIARRFGEPNSETFRNFGLATAIKLLALPEGTEQEFIAEQAAAGNPVEKQSAREVQRHVAEFKAKRKSPTQELPNAREHTAVQGELPGETFHVGGKVIVVDAEPDTPPVEVLAGTTNAPTTFKYYLKARRPLGDAAPRGFDDYRLGEVTGVAKSETGQLSRRTFFGFVIYNKPLSDEQVLNFDLAVAADETPATVVAPSVSVDTVPAVVAETPAPIIALRALVAVTSDLRGLSSIRDSLSEILSLVETKIADVPVKN